MDRRTFLATFAAGTAALAIPAARATDSRGAYMHAPWAAATRRVGVLHGDYVFFTGSGITHELLTEAKEVLQPGIDAVVPLDRQHEIKWDIREALSVAGDPLAQRGLIGWAWYAPAEH
jgi:hypothetical protein